MRLSGSNFGHERIVAESHSWQLREDSIGQGQAPEQPRRRQSFRAGRRALDNAGSGEWYIQRSSKGVYWPVETIRLDGT